MMAFSKPMSVKDLKAVPYLEQPRSVLDRFWQWAGPCEALATGGHTGKQTVV